LRLGTPLWLPRHRERDTRFPTLRRDLDVEAVIVGGGITGATIAWRFADAGLRVALLEAKRAGRGSTAASTALLMQEPDEDYASLADRYGEQRTRRIWKLSRRATRDFVDVIGRLRIPCRLARRDSVYYTLGADKAARLRKEHHVRRAASMGGRWLDCAALLRETGIHGAGAIRTRGNAQVDPYAACLGFLDAAARRGAHIFERSPVQRITPSKDGVTVTTARGSIRANRVIIATGYATPYFKPLAARFRLLDTYVVGTRPLTPSERRRLGLGAVMLWDTDRPYHYARWTDDHRLMLGGADRPHVKGRRRKAALRDGVAAVREYFRSLYPLLNDVEYEAAWEGLFAMTPDSLPYIGPHRRYPRHLFALGYGGNGMTFGFLAAKLLLDHYRGDIGEDHALFAFNRGKLASW
jgi:glycine/D-amino acid oxidase-like deaminating enzyme